MLYDYAMLAVWLSGSTLVSINQVTLRITPGPVSTGMGDRSDAENLSQYITSHPSLLQPGHPCVH